MRRFNWKDLASVASLGGLLHFIVTTQHSIMCSSDITRKVMNDNLWKAVIKSEGKRSWKISVRQCSKNAKEAESTLSILNDELNQEESSHHNYRSRTRSWGWRERCFLPRRWLASNCLWHGPTCRGFLCSIGSTLSEPILGCELAWL